MGTEQAIIAERINESRITQGVTVKALAQDAGLARTTLDRCLRGQAEFPASKLVAVSKALGLTASDVLEGL